MPMGEQRGSCYFLRTRWSGHLVAPETKHSENIVFKVDRCVNFSSQFFLKLAFVPGSILSVFSSKTNIRNYCSAFFLKTSERFKGPSFIAKSNVLLISSTAWIQRQSSQLHLS